MITCKAVLAIAAMQPILPLKTCLSVKHMYKICRLSHNKQSALRTASKRLNGCNAKLRHPLLQCSQSYLWKPALTSNTCTKSAGSAMARNLPSELNLRDLMAPILPLSTARLFPGCRISHILVVVSCISPILLVNAGLIFLQAL